MPELRIEATRGAHTESVHRVSVAVVDGDGRVVATAGDPGLVTFWRSAAKPFQAMPLVQDGAAEAFGLGEEELALACASHSSEPAHLAVVDRFLARIGCREDQLACGPHLPLSPAVAARVSREGITLSPRWSNCSGKHAGMLALALHRGWSTEGYERLPHPVQERLLSEVGRWTGVDRFAIGLAVDGCTAVSFALPLLAMARAYASFGLSDEPAARRIRGAMLLHPLLVAGSGRPCTDLMSAWPGRIVAKVGAAGIYCAALPRLGLGIALKVEDGAGDAGPPALLAVLRALVERAGCAESDYSFAGLALHREHRLFNTRGIAIGALRAAGTLRFRDWPRRNSMRDLPALEV